MTQDRVIHQEETSIKTMPPDGPLGKTVGIFLTEIDVGGPAL